MQNIYKIELEITEADNCRAHKVGETFLYPRECGRMCQWLLDSSRGMLTALMYGGRLPWTYSGTPYAKAIDTEGVTTEFIRCPDPTAKVVLKVTRTKIGYVDTEGTPHLEQNT